MHTHSHQMGNTAPTPGAAAGGGRQPPATPARPTVTPAQAPKPATPAVARPATSSASTSTATAASTPQRTVTIVAPPPVPAAPASAAPAAAAAAQPRKTSQDVVKMLGKGSITEKYDIDLNTILGKGHYAIVNLGKNKVTGEAVAVKRIQINRSRVEALKTEITTLLEVGKHPNIVELKDVYLTDHEVLLVMELLRGGELFERMEKYGAYNEQTAKRHILKITEALRFLHSKGIVHRDLKPENLMLVSSAESSDVKIADFGLSKMVNDVKSSVMNTVCGTWAYCAPEVKPRRPGVKSTYNFKVDTWSLGVILYVILVAFHPFDPDNKLNDGELWQAICVGKYSFDDPAWKGVSEQAKDLIRNLIVTDPEKRFSCEQVLAHPWLAEAGKPAAAAASATKPT